MQAQRASECITRFVEMHLFARRACVGATSKLTHRVFVYVATFYYQRMVFGNIEFGFGFR